MTNLTLSISADLLARARLRAAQDGTTVNAEVRRHLEAYAQEADDSAEVKRRILQWSDLTHASSQGRAWSRADAYCERLGRDDG